MPSLLIGGLGFIGASLVEELTKTSKDRICVIARKQSLERRPRLVNKYRQLGVRISAPQQLTPDRIRGAAKNCGEELEVYYLAGRLSNGEDAWKAHVDLAREAIRAVADQASTIVYTSAAPVIAECKNPPRDPAGRIVEEEKHLENCKIPRLGFLASKYIGEKRFLETLEENGLKGAIARPVAVYGPHAIHHTEWRKIYRLAKKGLAIDIPIDAVYSRDVARALIHIARKGKKKWYYIASPEKYTIGMLSRELAQLYGRRTRRIPVKPVEILSRIAYRLRLHPRISLLGAFIAKKLTFYPKNLVEEGFTKWQTGRKTALEEFHNWLKQNY